MIFLTISAFQNFSFSVFTTMNSLLRLLAALDRPSGFFISKFQHFRFSAFQLLPLLLAPVLCAQSPGDLAWVRTSLSSGNGQADTRAMWMDGNDNLFAVGVFKGTVDLFGTTLTATSETVYSGFVAKFSPKGTPQWVTKIGTTAVTELNAVAGFPNGEILVGGTASGNFASGAVSFSIPRQRPFLRPEDSRPAHRGCKASGIDETMSGGCRPACATCFRPQGMMRSTRWIYRIKMPRAMAY
jgi:hypothetical protein